MQPNMPLAAARERVVRELEKYRSVHSESALDALKLAISEWQHEVDALASAAE